ncbi:protein-glutamate methylesterase/protein-glutamine glutaminase [Leptothrix discophora]|uniref:Protein-glutamate methylesterase/protein-glutamine glutaminase n=1 Tax=Leptothrix discophora TaxID=89 RepID=A0ABT9G6P8_LEPDI|nr:chemotaxis response regulator protein-glutamate methylesterase [Leptothrix discophora]MDP4302154.1 chemotaxis response regulator protein-glutamate methylesterase [Leptothrix discophora]
MTAIRAMIVDDSAVVRKHLSDLLTQAGIEVIATASDPLFALPKMRSDWPDVLVLDVEMPRMDGISFLRQLMAERPTPVVMCSTLTEAGCETTLQAMEAGAVGFVTKPRIGLRNFLEDTSNGLVEAVRAAAQANLRAVRAAMPKAPAPATAGRRPMTTSPASTSPASTSPATTGPVGSPASATASAMARTTDRVIALGLSTGGVQTLEKILRDLPRTVPGIVVVQHMPANFTASFAARLDRISQLEVLEARDGERVINGRVLIAPGGRHMRLKRSGAQYVVEVLDGPLINHHRPSVDVLFRSVAQVAGANAVGMVLTGMGDDGSRGLLEMRRAGALTAAQDEASSIVYGMPREAVRHGGTDTQLALDDIPAWIKRIDAPQARALA